MKVIVIGLGSMGKRRIRLMQKLDMGIQVIGIDSNKKRLEDVEKEFGIRGGSDLDEALKEEGILCGFVCTSPLSHKDIILKLLKSGLHVFTEINLVSDGYDDILKIKSDNQVLFLSSTLLYRKDVKYIIKEVSGKKVDYMYHTGQFLPDWHIWESIDSFFVSDARTNGCREIMAIEFPWIIKCFGKIEKVTVLKDKMSDLKITYPDNYLIQLVHSNGTKGQIVVDVVSRKAMRRLEIFNQNLQVFWDGTPESLAVYDVKKKEMEKIETYKEVTKDNKYCDNIIEDAYLDEILSFFEQINAQSKKCAEHSFEDDYEILSLIDSIER